MNLHEYFGALKSNPLLDKLEADSKIVREAARPRANLMNTKAIID